MPKLTTLIALLAALLAATPAPAQQTTLRTGLLLDGKGATLRNQLITIDGPRITAITPATNAPATYNLANLTLLPA